jgi:hypothetical protein
MKKSTLEPAATSSALQNLGSFILNKLLTRPFTLVLSKFDSGFLYSKFNWGYL